MAATTASTSASTRHFPGRHYEGAASGPFAALNPTVRRFPLAAKPAAKKAKDDDEQQPDDDEQQLSGDDDAQVKHADAPKGTEPVPAKNEVRADDVQRQWRSRDNRKGKSSLHFRVAEIELRLQLTEIFGTHRPTCAGNHPGRGRAREIPRTPADEQQRGDTEGHMADVQHLPVLGCIVPGGHDLHAGLGGLGHQRLLLVAAAGGPVDGVR